MTIIYNIKYTISMDMVNCVGRLRRQCHLEYIQYSKFNIQYLARDTITNVA